MANTNKNMTFQLDLLPDISNTYSLGNADQQWMLNGGTPVLTSDLGTAAGKQVDDVLTSGTSSTNLPTSAAVVNFIESQSGTKINKININILITDWVSNEETTLYTYEISNTSVTSETMAYIFIDNTYYNLVSDLTVTTSTNLITVTTANLPIGTISGIMILF